MLSLVILVLAIGKDMSAAKFIQGNRQTPIRGVHRHIQINQLQDAAPLSQGKMANQPMFEDISSVFVIPFHGFL